MGRSHEGSARCLRSCDGVVEESGLSELCHKGAVVLREYEGGMEADAEQG